MNNPHQNARLTVHSREQIVARIVAGQTAAEVAAAFAVSVRTVRKWLARFRAGGGGVTAGRSYIVGERGPELFTPGRSGGITPNSAMKGGGTMVQINNYSGAPVREQRSTGPDGRELVKVIVGEELGSGGYDKQLGRYGSTPAKVKR